MKRDYGIDLVKMLAMVMVVAHHILMYGDFEAKLGRWGALSAVFFIVFVIVR